MEQTITNTLARNSNNQIESAIKALEQLFAQLSKHEQEHQKIKYKEYYLEDYLKKNK